MVTYHKLDASDFQFKVTRKPRVAGTVWTCICCGRTELTHQEWQAPEPVPPFEVCGRCVRGARSLRMPPRNFSRTDQHNIAAMRAIIDTLNWEIKNVRYVTV